jgi:hypothetical protein
LSAITNVLPEGWGSYPNWIAAWEPQLILPSARLERSTSGRAVIPWAPAKRQTIQQNTRLPAVSVLFANYSYRPSNTSRPPFILIRLFIGRNPYARVYPKVSGLSLYENIGVQQQQQKTQVEKQHKGLRRQNLLD